MPDPPETVQVCPDGFVFTVTAYAAPLASGVANVNDPFAASSGHPRRYPAAPPSPTAPTQSRPPCMTWWGLTRPFPPVQLPAVERPAFAMMPGSPPVKVVLVTEICWTPFSHSDTVLPTAWTCSIVPAGNADTLTELPSWVQFPAFRKNSISSGLPLFQK